jgi:glycine/D-amino acid oxidase-like deaminating enzyme
MPHLVIIGAGIIGATIAYELSKQNNLKITLIEEKLPASGATQAALGVMMGIISHKTKGKLWQLRQISLDRYETLIPELELITGINIPYNTQGIVSLILHQEEIINWEKLAQIRSKQGFKLEIWRQEELKKYCPYIENEQIVGAVYSPRDRQVNPTILTESLVEAATQNSVNTKFTTKVLELNYRDNICYQIKTTQGIIPVDWVVICAAIGATFLSPSLEIRPVLGQALQLKLPHHLEPENFQPVITGEDVHIVPLQNREYWLGATVEFPLDTGEVVARAELLETVKEMAYSFCPSLAAGEIIKTWQGKRPRPEGKAAPVLENLDNYVNVFLATGHYRNGILLAPATAQWVREKITV